MATGKSGGGTQRASVAGKFFRRLADFFDAGGTAVFAGTRREVDILTLSLVFLGLMVAGTWIHGWPFFFWNFLFAAAICAGSWLIFSSARWRLTARALLLSGLLLISVGAAAERLFALMALVLLFFLMLRSLWPVGDGANLLRREAVSVAGVALFCFFAYDIFAGVLEWRRNALLSLSSELSISCATTTERTDCRAGDTAFSVPAFWRHGRGSALIRDFSSVMKPRVYADGATDNSIAFAAFSAPTGQVLQQLTNFLVMQKGFLRSKNPDDKDKGPLVPQRLMAGPDAQLYAIRYESATLPGYLAGRSEFTALLLLHERRGVTWLFILDGAELTGREFLLHRIISGFH